MDEKTLKNLEQFEKMFEHACQVCDPLDYTIRQRNLMYSMASLMLLPLMEYREALKKANEEKSNAVESV